MIPSIPRYYSFPAWCALGYSHRPNASAISGKSRFNRRTIYVELVPCKLILSSCSFVLSPPCFSSGSTDGSAASCLLDWLPLVVKKKRQVYNISHQNVYDISDNIITFLVLRTSREKIILVEIALSPYRILSLGIL